MDINVIVIKNTFSTLNADRDDVRTIRRTTQKGKAFKTKITWLCFYALFSMDGHRLSSDTLS